MSLRAHGLTAAALVLAACAACSAGTDEPAASGSATPTTQASSQATPSPAATPAAAAPRPRDGSCHRLSFTAAVAPTDESRAVPCRQAHTSVTFRVGDLDAVVGGHLLAVDSRRVQQGLATTCPAALPAYVGGTVRDLRTSMLRAIWFSPTIEQADEGQDWYRCDVTVLAAADRLAPISRDADGDLEGALDEPDWQDAYGMCGTADPASADFERVVCARPHAWEAIGSVDAENPDGAYPGVAALTDPGTDGCEGSARARAEDPLTVTWGYEPPTRAQWRGGQHYGLCWVPTPS